MNTQLLTREQSDGTQEFDLWCVHGHVTTEEVRRAFSPDEILGTWIVVCQDLPDETAEPILQMVTVAQLLAGLLQARYECSCGVEPLVFVERPAPSDGVH